LGYHNVQFASIAGYWFPVPDDQSAVLNNSEPQVNMAPEEYTHIRVLKELHGVLKSEADRAGVSIADYITELQRRNQAFETLMAGVSGVNIPIAAERDDEKRLNQKRRTDPAVLALSWVRTQKFAPSSTLPPHAGSEPFSVVPLSFIFIRAADWVV